MNLSLGNEKWGQGRLFFFCWSVSDILQNATMDGQDESFHLERIGGVGPNDSKS